MHTSYVVSVFPKTRDLLLISLTLIGGFVLLRAFSVLGSSLSLSFPDIDPNTFLLATPVAAGGLLLEVTLGGPGVFLLVMSFSLLAGVFLQEWIFLLFIIIGNIVAAVSVKHCSRRTIFLLAGVRIAFVNAGIVACYLLVFPQVNTSDSFFVILFAIIGGIISGIVGAALTPVVESIGGYISDIKLLELASLDRPLLRELSLQAPGTWNHSVLMAQMAEDAAREIGANSLLARVGCYYHDIGKKRKPAYFAENQVDRDNRHDKLTPSMSALIIKSHVKDGIELAKKHRLPPAIIDLIPQHHGTSLIEYFYEKAAKEAETEDLVDETHYRYPGPKPQTKEAAILMLADSVEASARTIPDPTPAKIQGAVQKIINKIFSSGELAECDLTLKDLHLIARSFIRVLSAVYHRRVEYSEPAEKGKAKKEAKPKANGSEESSAEKPKEKSNGVPKSDDSGSTGESRGGKPAEEGADEKGDTSENKEALKRLGI